MGLRIAPGLGLGNFLVRPIGKTSIKRLSSPCDAEDFILVAAKEQSQSLYHLISLAYMWKISIFFHCLRACPVWFTGCPLLWKPPWTFRDVKALRLVCGLKPSTGRHRWQQAQSAQPQEQTLLTVPRSFPPVGNSPFAELWSLQAACFVSPTSDFPKDWNKKGLSTKSVWFSSLTACSSRGQKRLQRSRTTD